jgi:sialic acid synthase SpsE|tara:strand:+ start:940 stop:1665 length:726 start_codon:yes stop_codon:yes gene_type:complete
MKTTIIAEIGLNHNGNMEMAKCLIDEAHRAGADIAKFQFFDISEYFGPEFEWYEECMKARIDYDKAEMLRDYCDKVGIEFMSSVFNLQGVEWAEKLGMKRYKIASRCIGQQDLFDAVGETGKDMIVSLGMWHDANPTAPLPTHIKSKGKVDFLYCVAKYPTMPEDVDFDKIDFKDKYSGFSDHTIGMNAPLIAVARGAKILEKHFTLSKKMHGPDHQGSMEPNELRQLVKSAREFEEFMSK